MVFGCLTGSGCAASCAVRCAVRSGSERTLRGGFILGPRNGIEALKARYGLLGRAGHWFPGANADALDTSVSEELLLSVLNDSPWRDRIPSLLRSLRERAGGSPQERLSST